MIEIPILKELVSYNAETGELFWKARMSDKTPAGKLAGSKRKDGYVVNGLCIHLGNFSCPNAAHAAYLTAKKQYHISQPAAILAGEAVAGARIVRRDRLTIR